MMRQYDANNGVVYIKHEVNKNGAAAINMGIKYSLMAIILLFSIMMTGSTPKIEL